MSLNMQKEIRRELKQLRGLRHKVCLDWTAEIKRLGAENRKIRSALNQANRNSSRAVVRIDRRLAMLQGRLS